MIALRIALIQSLKRKWVIKQKNTLLSKIYPAVGFVNEQMWIFIAKDLYKTVPNLDSNEILEVVSISIKDAVKMVWNCELTDAKTIIGILWADRILT